MKTEERKKTAAAFTVTLIVILAVLAGSILRTNLYNRRSHQAFFSGPGLFSPEEETGAEVSVKAFPGAAPGPSASTSTTRAWRSTTTRPTLTISPSPTTPGTR